MKATIGDERGVEGFGDPQYDMGDELELLLRIAVYTFFQNRRASEELSELSMTQDWYGNTLHVKGNFKPRQLAKVIIETMFANDFKIVKAQDEGDL